MKKKKGSTLVVVLGIMFALSIIGLSIFTYVKNSSTLNKESTDKIITENNVKSALNIAEYKFIKGEAKSGDITNIVKDELINLNENNKNFNLKVEVIKEKENRFRIEAKGQNGSSEYTASETSYINKKEKETTKADIDLFLNSASGITILNKGSIDWTGSPPVTITSTTLNVNGYYGNPDEYLKNTGNMSVYNKNTNIPGSKRSMGLKLKLSKGNIRLTDNHSEFIRAYKKIGGTKIGSVILMGKKDSENKDSECKVIELKKLKSEEIEGYKGAIINLGDDKKLILVNGDLINDTSPFSFNNCFMYTTSRFITRLNGVSHITYSNIVTNYGVVIGGGTNIYSKFNVLSKKDILRECLSKFTV